MEEASGADLTDNFKPVFKQYKRRDQPLDLSDVIDLEKLTDSSGSSDSIRRVTKDVPDVTPVAGLRPVQDWSIFQFLQHPGFYVVRNPFAEGSERYWVSRCLQDLPRPPNVTNLAVHPDITPDTVWGDFVQDFHHRGSDAYNSSSPLRKLRWTTIGYHHNWDTKEYTAENHTSFPEDIAVLTSYVARVLDFPQFQAEAGIINYYHRDSTLAAHTDHSELDHQAPLFSISFGQDAIFLLGGRTKAQTPTALRLHSGDICVMSGEARLAYHAVPRILPSPSHTAPPSFLGTAGNGGDWDCVRDRECAKDSDCVENAKRVRDRECDKDTQYARDTEDVRDTECVRDIERVGDAVCNSITKCFKDQDSHKSATDSSIEQRDCTCAENRALTTCTSVQCTTSVYSDVSKEEALTFIHTPHSPQNVDASSVHTSLDTSASSQNTQNISDCKATNSLMNSPKSTQHTDSQIAISHIANQTSQSTDSSQKPSEWTGSTYEARVRKVNRQIISTLRNLDWRPFAAYLAASRLNLNIRQVLPAGQTFGTTDPVVGPDASKKARTEL